MPTLSGNLLQQIVQQFPVSNGFSPEVLQQLVTQTTAPTMPLSLDSLINQLQPVKANPGSQLLQAAKSSVLEAVVISNSPLMKTTGGDNQVQITINFNKQLFDLKSNHPVPAGTRIQLQLAENQQTLLLKVLSSSNSATEQNHFSKPPGIANLTGNVALTTPLTAPRQDGPQTGNVALTQTSTLQVLEQGIRNTLPLQQPLKSLVPLLIQSVQNPGTIFPKQLTQNLNQLLKQFPNPSQLQQPQQLKNSLKNSGLFLEAKLAQSLLTESKQLTSSQQTSSVLHNQLNTDIKALLQKIIPQLQRTNAQSSTPTAEYASSIQRQTGLYNTHIGSLLTSEETSEQPLIYGNKPLPHQTITHTSPKVTTSDSNTDILLRQLSQQLLASLARTQLNQLESLAARQQNSPDSQGPTNSWHIEIPIIQGKQVDNLDLLIEQHYPDEDKQTDTPSTKQWTVMLNFDLHQLGKLNVQLSIIDNNVSATVWSQLENTHKAVKQQLQSLRNNLEKIGVKVNALDCHLGSPPKANMTLYKQLVDVRT